MLNDFFPIFAWWIIVSGLGIICLPFAWHLFHRFWDYGYAFSKIIGILIVSYLVWLWGSLKIFSFTSQTIWLAIAVTVGINFLIIRRQSKKFKKEIKSRWRIFAFEEGLFFIAFTTWAYIRSFQPDIYGLEKFMDYGFINSILRSRFFPPADMWLAGKTINYYYFGHLVAAVLTKLSGLNSAITYNLMVALLFGLCFTAAFCLGANLFQTPLKQKKTGQKKAKLPFLSGLFTACLLTLGGNLQPLYWWLKNKNFNGYWYPDATRFIVPKFGAADNTIHEFPNYSFVVADLHGHLFNLPFVLLMLALLFSAILSKKVKSSSLALASFLLAIFFMTNAWDFPIYLLTLGLTILYLNFLKHRQWAKTLIQTAKSIIFCLFLAILFSLPFHLHFQNISQGIGLVDFHSPAWMLLVLWGFPLITSFAFIIFLAANSAKIKNKDNFILILLGVSWLLILTPELIYVKDIYIHSHQRANTMFKLTYQAFVMLSLSIGYIIIQILTRIKQKHLKISYLFLNLFFLTFIFIYPHFSVLSYYGLKNYHGLYGLNYLQRSHPDDYQAILWLKRNLTGQPVIVEAVGESYTDFGRVSANTGLPTLLGWRVHEWLWRGSFDEPGKRTEIVRQIYESKNLNQTRQLLKQYQVKYLFLGSLERKQYPQLDKSKWNQLGKVIFSSGKTKIYQIID